MDGRDLSLNGTVRELLGPFLVRNDLLEQSTLEVLLQPVREVGLVDGGFGGHGAGLDGFPFTFHIGGTRRHRGVALRWGGLFRGFRRRLHAGGGSRRNRLTRSLLRRILRAGAQQHDGKHPQLAHQ